MNQMWLVRKRWRELLLAGILIVPAAAAYDEPYTLGPFATEPSTDEAHAQWQIEVNPLELELWHVSIEVATMAANAASCFTGAVVGCIAAGLACEELACADYFVDALASALSSQESASNPYREKLSQNVDRVGENYGKLTWEDYVVFGINMALRIAACSLGTFVAGIAIGGGFGGAVAGCALGMAFATALYVGTASPAARDFWAGAALVAWWKTVYAIDWVIGSISANKGAASELTVDGGVTLTGGENTPTWYTETRSGDVGIYGSDFERIQQLATGYANTMVSFPVSAAIGGLSVCLDQTVCFLTMELEGLGQFNSDPSGPASMTAGLFGTVSLLAGVIPGSGDPVVVPVVVEFEAGGASVTDSRIACVVPIVPCVPMS